MLPLKHIKVLTTIALVALSFPLSTLADTNVSQAGANPIIFNQTANSDNIVYLMAAGSEHNSGLTVRKAYPKHYYVTNFDDNTNDYFKWTVNLNSGANYSVWALLNSGVSIPLKLTVEGTSYALTKSTQAIGWDKFDMGSIYIPAGKSTLKLVRNASVSGNIEIKSLELIRTSDLPAYKQRVANYKRDMTWLSEATYGLMFQYGAWGYPQTGDRKSIDQGAADFNVDKFVSMVKDTGASYVIWSMTWWQYWIQAPLTSVDEIMGNSSLTSKRDLIGEVAQALQDNGIRFMLYYHQGLQQEPTWAAKQNFPGEFDDTGTGDRTTFFNNWKKVIADVGNRYGKNLDGWFFDDGAAYYPAPFESLAAAARTGNPDRLISYNNINAVRYTDFQDMTLGESKTGGEEYGSAANGGNGIYTKGPMEGLLQHSMFKMDNGWGIHDPNSVISTSISSSKAVAIATAADARNVPLSFDMLMYEDGTVSSNSLNVLYAVKDAVGNGNITPTGMINNTASGITYTGSWATSSGRSKNDYLDDLHYTTVNGAFFEYTFSGSGIKYIAPKYTNYGDVDIYIDGVLQETASCYSSSYLAQQTIYSVSGLSSGSHTLKVVKKNGSYMQLDGLIVDTTAVGQSPYTLKTIPGVIQAEEYDKGGQGIAYNDTTTGNSGSSLRSDDVDIQATSDVGGGYNLGWIANGEWLEYSIYDVTDGIYNIELRVAAQGTAAGKGIKLTLDGKNLGTVNFSGTDGWQTWETVTLENVAISSESDVILRLDMIGGGFNLNDIEFIPSSGNIALGKTTSQSSIAYNGESSRAVDGNTDGEWNNDSITHTNNETQAWWEIDLGAVSNIDVINLWNRTDSCCASRLSNFYVFVSDTPFSSKTLSTTKTQSGVSSFYFAGQASTTTLVDVNRSGRYVRVQLEGTNPLSLAEVEIIGSGN